MTSVGDIKCRFYVSVHRATTYGVIALATLLMMKYAVVSLAMSMISGTFV